MTTLRYEADGWHKFLEEDIFSDGCQPDTSASFCGNERFSGDTADDVITAFCDFCGVENTPENVSINACEEAGRVDVFSMENADGYAARPHELESWKAGKTRLWNVVYSIYVKAVRRDIVYI